MLSRFVAIPLVLAVACGGSVDADEAREAGPDAIEEAGVDVAPEDAQQAQEAAVDAPTEWFCNVNAAGDHCVCFDHSVFNIEQPDCPALPYCVACAGSCTCSATESEPDAGCVPVEACPIGPS